MSKCPVCSKGVAEKYRPFCSKRCADVDLGRWFTESYVVESEELAVDDSSLDDEEKVYH